MTPSEQRRANVAFARARACRPEERAAVLDDACGGDEELRRRVEEMLAAATEVLEEPDGWGSDTHIGGGAAMLVGRTVDARYEIRELLGVGGMGAVYRARQRSLDREVALKVVRAEVDSSPGTRERFAREARAIARLRHPSIVTIHDFGVDPAAGAYIVMEMLRGRSLGAELGRRGPLAVAETVALLRQICGAVDAAHAAGVLHRDLKPDNVWLEDAPDGRRMAKVLDFGLAKLTDAMGDPAQSLTQIGVVMGTPAYMSPEQCRGEVVDARSDVYALGCVAYAMLTGEPPFRSRNSWALVYKHVNEEPRPPSEFVSGVSRDLDTAILKALAKAPEHRFASAADFAAAIGGLAPVQGDANPTLLNANRSPAQSGVGNLPAGMKRLIGREELIRDVLARLEDTRLVTLTGAGGIGKTRLALEVAREALVSFGDGAWLVELAALEDPSRVARSVAQTLDVREESGRDVEETLVDRLGEKHLLLVLDNCEHLVDACAALAATLLRACPNLRVLATSREPLGAEGEVALPVPTLTLPEAGAFTPADALERYEATALFVERASLGRPGFAPSDQDAADIASLCLRLDGIPLAIELAAARVRTLSVRQVVERLDDRFRLLTTGSRTAPRRQQTLRAAVDWSYDLLTDDERWLFRRLSVFADGWSLEAAEAVCAADRREAEAVLDLLARLIDKSFVLVEDWAGEARYRMLETLRIYAAERLADADDGPSTIERHTEWFVLRAERAEAELSGPSHGVWLDRLETEHENLRAVLRRVTTDRASGETALRVCAALGRFWTRRGHVREGLEWTEAALACAPEAPTIVWTKALYTRGLLRYFGSNYDGAIADLERAAEAQRSLGDRRGLARTLYTYATVRDARMEHEAATALALECLAAAREAGDRHMEAMAGSTLGRIALRGGDTARASELFAESLAICREVGSTRDASLMLFNLGQAAIDQGELERAAAYLAESTEIARSLGDKIMLAGSRALSGIVAIERGDVAGAEPPLRDAIVLFHRMNNRVDLAYLMEALARSAVIGGDARRALFLGGAAARLRETIGARLTEQERSAHETNLARAKEALGADAAERAFTEGGAASVDQAVEVAIGARSLEP